MPIETPDPLEAARSERDRLVNDGTLYQNIIAGLKEQLRDERLAKEEALRELSVVRDAWKTTQHTKEALTNLSSLSPTDAEALLVRLSQKEQLEEELAETKTTLKLVAERERIEAQLACDLRSSQDTIIERCSQAVRAKWPEAADLIRSHADGISGEDWGELNRELAAVKAERDRLSAHSPDRFDGVNDETRGLVLRAEADKWLAEQSVRNLAALLDRDGGHRQALDASLAVTALRVDAEISRLQRRDEALAAMEKTDGHLGVLKIVRAFLPLLSDSAREKFFYEIEEGYCGSCGRVLRSADDFCQCDNDE